MKMLTKAQEQRQAIEMLCTDMLVPQDHLLRKIDAAVDFKHIYEIVEDLYCEDNGRPSCDPVVLFKLDMIKHLFGIRSLRQTLRDAEVNEAYLISKGSADTLRPHEHASAICPAAHPDKRHKPAQRRICPDSHFRQDTSYALPILSFLSVLFSLFRMYIYLDETHSFFVPRFSRLHM